MNSIQREFLTEEVISKHYDVAVYTVYKTTNILTSEYYIGEHKTKFPMDSYLGSGIRFSRALKEVGKRYFRKEILFIFTEPIPAFDKEVEILKICLSDSLCYNTVYNARNYSVYSPEALKTVVRRIGDRLRGRKHTEEHCRNSSLALLNRIFSKEACTNFSKAAKKRWTDPIMRKNLLASQAKAREERKARGRFSHKENTKQYLSLYQQTLHTITNGIVNTRVLKTEPVPEGFRIGITRRKKIQHETCN